MLISDSDYVNTLEAEAVSNYLLQVQLKFAKQHQEKSRRVIFVFLLSSRPQTFTAIATLGTNPLPDKYSQYFIGYDTASENTNDAFQHNMQSNQLSQWNAMNMNRWQTQHKM